jgi:hypothetical protein
MSKTPKDKPRPPADPPAPPAAPEKGKIGAAVLATLHRIEKQNETIIAQTRPPKPGKAPARRGYRMPWEKDEEE